MTGHGLLPGPFLVSTVNESIDSPLPRISRSNPDGRAQRLRQLRTLTARILSDIAAMDLQQFSPGLLSYPEPPEFDYSSFLQGEDIPFHDPSHGGHSGGHLSESSGKLTPPSSGSDNRSTASGATDAVARRQPTQKQRLERRGHTKSRRGCYNCKRRRIKVCETPRLVLHRSEWPC